ncbi:MAG: DUF427 domain-containing protein [Cytophagales bacterium]|nr:DUF427 domain-containing protein [Cytophagales bacterium]
MKAIWNNQILAKRDTSVQLEGNHYFPLKSMNKDFLIGSQAFTICPRKGQGPIYCIDVYSKDNWYFVWYNPDPKPRDTRIKSHVAFWKGLEIVK